MAWTSPGPHTPPSRGIYSLFPMIRQQIATVRCVDLRRPQPCLHTKFSGWTEKLAIVKDVATGMEYIHSIGHIHRDLKSGNVLVSQDLRAKVCEIAAPETTYGCIYVRIWVCRRRDTRFLFHLCNSPALPRPSFPMARS